MARSHLGNRTDGNQTEVIKYFLDSACSVLNISALPNCCDLVVSKHGRSIFIEVKNGKNPPSKRKLTDGELKFKMETQGAWRLCESEKDADKIIAELNSTDPIHFR